MPWRLFLFCYLLFCLVAPARAQEVYFANWPDGIVFSGAVGQRFTFQARVTPQQCLPGETVFLELNVKGDGKTSRGPDRLDFQTYSPLTDKFDFEWISSTEGNEKKEWEFRFALKAKGKGTLEIPPLPLAFINPYIPWQSRQGMLVFSNLLMLEVKERGALTFPLRGPGEAFDTETLTGNVPNWIFSQARLDEFFWIMLLGPFLYAVSRWHNRYKQLISKDGEPGHPGWVKKNLYLAQQQPVSQQPLVVWQSLQTYFHTQFSGPKTWTSRDIEIFLPLLEVERGKELLEYYQQLESVIFGPSQSTGLPWASRALHWVSILEARK